MVLGFGINLLPAAYPPDIGERATSLAAELGRPVDAGVCLPSASPALPTRSGAHLGRQQSVLARWLRLAPSSHGSRVEWDGAAGPVSGVTAGITSDGALLVRAGARTEAIRSGVVRWL